MASILVSGDTSGAITISAPLVAGSGVLTLPTGTDTLIGKATTDTLTNKSIAATQLTGTIAAARLPAGSVIQVVSATATTNTSSAAAGYVTVGLSVAITPNFSSSKVLVLVNGGNLDTNTTNRQAYATILRNGTNLNGGPSSGMQDAFSSAGRLITPISISYLDSPATTSSTTYAAAMYSGGSLISFNSQFSTISIIAMEIAG